MRDDLQLIRDKTTELEIKVDRDINELKSSVEKGKNDTVRLAVGAAWCEPGRQRVQHRTRLQPTKPGCRLDGLRKTLMVVAAVPTTRAPHANVGGV